MPLAPGSTIGILGSGQLGRMLALAAARLGLRTQIYGGDANDPAMQVAQGFTLGAWDDTAALTAFGMGCDAITYEWESIPIDAVRTAAQGRKVSPNIRALETAQDRLIEKTFLRSAGLMTADFASVDSEDDLREALERMGGRGVLKTRRGGYDGKGQAMIRSNVDAAAAWDRLGDVPLILESLVEFSREVSVVAARGRDGSVAAYPLTQNDHRDHILHRSTAPAAQDDGSAGRAVRDVLDALDYVGVIGVEFFDTGSGDGEEGLIVNEIAPRVHNSGHWTQDAGCVCQFEQHIRAVAGWPLGSPAPTHAVEMINLVGDDVRAWGTYASKPDVRLHLYGKSEVRPGRKMGHVNRIGRPLD